MSDKKRFDDFRAFDPQHWERVAQGEKVQGPLSDQQLGVYSMKDMIGVGSLSTVYRANHVILKAPRAVKILRPDLAANPRFVNPFRYEASIGAYLDHPNIVKVYDAGMGVTQEIAAATYHYIAMEYVEGKSIDSVFTHERRPRLETALDVITTVAEALRYAHERGVIHNDLKPANIIMGKDGNIKLGDFGSAINLNWTALTRSQQSGTIMYTAPEVLQGEQPTFKSDIYSLGRISFELLTGELPSQDRNANALLLNRFFHRHKMSGSVSSFISDSLAMISRDPHDRPIRPILDGVTENEKKDEGVNSIVKAAKLYTDVISEGVFTPEIALELFKVSVKLIEANVALIDLGRSVYESMDKAFKRTSTDPLRRSRIASAIFQHIRDTASKLPDKESRNQKVSAQIKAAKVLSLESNVEAWVAAMERIKDAIDK